ncbi:MAG: TetR/AcrR family transcriptional regulator [Steroidobacteraceae bacterium]
MMTRETILAVALRLLDREGEARFSTRSVCAAAKVTAPTLYHHFGSADGLLSAALMEGFRQLLESKKAAEQSSDAESALREGWDDYVRFAAERPRLYAAMMARFLQGATIPAAEEAFALLRQQIAALEAEGRLAIEASHAASVMWAAANAAALLYVTAALQATHLSAPDPRVVVAIRDQAVASICKPRSENET